MIHPSTELRFINVEVGYGIIASCDLPAGTITWALDPLDRVFTQPEFDSLALETREVLDMYSFRDHAGNYVLCWDHGKYVNHSFRANCLSTPYGFEIAIRNIVAGEEITDEYGCFNVTKPFRGTDEGTRRKTVYPDDLLRYHREWDAILAKVMPRVIIVEQPLRRVVPDEVWAEVVSAVGGETPLASLKRCYFAAERGCTG